MPMDWTEIALAAMIIAVLMALLTLAVVMRGKRIIAADLKASANKPRSLRFSEADHEVHLIQLARQEGLCKESALSPMEWKRAVEIGRQLERGSHRRGLSDVLDPGA
jgi:hypothetical protein